MGRFFSPADFRSHDHEGAAPRDPRGLAIGAIARGTLSARLERQAARVKPQLKSVKRMKNTDPELARLAVRVGRELLRSERSAATAEWCTRGWIAKAMTDIAGSSQWFIEGFVTYSNESKVRRLGVPISVLKSQGAVSEAVARAMALGALRRSGAQVAVAVTGIAGPDGAVPGKPVGTVWLAWAVKRGVKVHVSADLKRFTGDREAVRRKT